MGEMHLPSFSLKAFAGLLTCGIVMSIICGPRLSVATGPYDWQTQDSYDEIRQRYDAVTFDNCNSKPTDELHLPKDTVAQPIRFNQLLTQIIFPNRTAMMHVHNMALNRAFFFSYIFQKLNTSETFYMLPGLFYQYFSMAADVSANPNHINGSAIMMDFNCTYANWYRNLPFNTTLPLFGPRGWRLDDFQYPTNWLREPTNRTIDIRDYGAGPQSNYTSTAYKINEWYTLWLPDGKDKAGLDSKTKQSYDIGIKYSNETGKFVKEEYTGFTFFGPPSPGINEKEHFPVLFTEPYFDCGRLNRWIVSAVAPIVDWMPRYLDWLHLRRFQFVGVAVMDMEFLFLDMNQCPIAIGNPDPNRFADTARCKKSTTQCEPLFGWGFRRGGYQCNCLPGYRYPPWQRGPFHGIQLESATENEKDNFFDCIPVELRQILPVIRSNDSFSYTRRIGVREAKEEKFENEFYKPNERERRAARAAKSLKFSRGPVSKMLDVRGRFLRSVNLKEIDASTKGNKRRKRFIPRYDISQPAPRKMKKKFVSRFDRDDEAIRKKRRKRSFDPDMRSRMEAIFKHKASVNKDNCKTFKPEELTLPGDVAYNADKQFTWQAKTALRLSHLLSNFLQNVDKYEEYGNLRGDRPLNIELVFGEALANVMGDLKIMGSGVFFDTDKWLGDNDPRQYFGPYAFRYLEPGVKQEDHAQTNFRAIDFAGFPTTYLEEPWFKHVKERWQSNTYGLTRFTEAPMIRSDLDGTSLNKFQIYPLYYSAPVEADGWWSEPYFDCDGYVDEWVITYSVPFFGFNSIGSALEFKGVVVVDVKLDHLDIDQCPMDFSVPNAFKNTARCYFDNQYCVPLPGREWMLGAYICECEQSFEYPFNDRAWYYDGQTMEEEYRKKTTGEPSRYDTLKCRFAGADRVSASLVLAVVLLSSILRYLFL